MVPLTLEAWLQTPEKARSYIILLMYLYLRCGLLAIDAMEMNASVSELHECEGIHFYLEDGCILFLRNGYLSPRLRSVTPQKTTTRTLTALITRTLNP